MLPFYYSLAVTVTVAVSVNPLSVLTVNVPVPALTPVTTPNGETVNTVSLPLINVNSLVASTGVNVTVTFAVASFTTLISLTLIAVAGLGCAVARQMAFANGQIAKVPPCMQIFVPSHHSGVIKFIKS